MFGYDAQSESVFGTLDYRYFECVSFSSKLKNNVWTITWALVRNGVECSGEFKGAPIECEDYIWNGDEF